MTEVGGASDFPRTLWMLWLQGWENAPEVIQRCLHSWKHHNPRWTIRLLDADNLRDWVDLSDLSPVPEEDFSVQSFSDIVRLYLIKSYGGVWADATCFCRRPLDEWLFDSLHSGFFAFERSGLPSGWFFGATPDNRATALWWDELQTYWTDCPPRLRASVKNPRLIDRLLDRMQLLGLGRLQPVRPVDRPLRTLGKLLEQHSGIRFSPLFRNVLKHAPYYWFNMLFMNLLQENPEVRRIWDNTPKTGVVGLVEMGGFSRLVAPISDRARQAIDKQRVPVYKLNWRLDLEKAGPDSLLGYLFSTVPTPVQYNDWRRTAVAAPEAFVPELPASVIVPYRAQPEELGRTLSALERQTYPRELFEVVVVDDGSPEPPEHPRKTPLDVKVVRQENLGFGLARARNTGARTAAHDILVFLDPDMVPEAEWLEAHARWHHAVPDAVTLGLFEASKTDDQLWMMTGGDIGIGRRFYELAGEFDESLAERGGEDTEFGYRTYVRGGLLVPVREGVRTASPTPYPGGGAGKNEPSRELQRAKLAHLIAHPDFRTGTSGRTFAVPQYVVTIRGGTVPAERLLETVERVLSGSVHDLVVRVELSAGHAGRAWLEHHLGPDPRVRVAPSRSALKEFPASPFHVTLPAGRQLHADVVRRLRAALGTAVIGKTDFRDGSRVSIARARALHRALRMPQDVFSDFGEVVAIPPRKLVQAGGARRRARENR